MSSRARRPTGIRRSDRPAICAPAGCEILARSGPGGRGAAAPGLAWPVDEPCRRRRPSRTSRAPAGASRRLAHTRGTEAQRSPRAGPSALPQFCGALAAGPVPVPIAGRAPAAGGPHGWLPTLAAWPESRGGPRRVGRAFDPMTPPVHRAHRTASLNQPVPGWVDAPTDPTGARGHLPPLTGAITPRYGPHRGSQAILTLPPLGRPLPTRPAPVPIAGITPATVDLLHELPTSLTGARGPHRPWRELRRALDATAAPVHLAHGTAPLAEVGPGSVDAPTDAAGPRRHPPGPTGATTPARSGGECTATTRPTRRSPASTNDAYSLLAVAVLRLAVCPTAATPRTEGTGRAAGATAPRAGAPGSSCSGPPGRGGTVPGATWPAGAACRRRRPRRSPRVDPLALPQPRRVLDSVGPPVMVAGIAAPTGELGHAPPTGSAEARGRGPLGPMLAPIGQASPAAPLALGPGVGEAPTDTARARGHPTAATTRASAPTTSGGNYGNRSQGFPRTRYELIRAPAARAARAGPGA
jgi:hypothetical protein